MQGGLIRHSSREKRSAVIFERDRQTIEPVCPLSAEMSVNPDLIVIVGCRFHAPTIFAPLAFVITLKEYWGEYLNEKRAISARLVHKMPLSFAFATACVRLLTPNLA